MLVERMTYQAKFGQGDAVAAAFTAWRDRYAPRFGLNSRVLVDLAGPMFTVVFETEYRDLAHLAEAHTQLQAFFADREFQDWFATWHDLTESGTREFLRIVE